MDSMWEALRVRRGACIAFIGAGGKTTSILALAELAVTRGLTVAVTTTTKFWPPPGMPLVLQVDEDDIVGAARLQLRDSSTVAVGSDLAGSGKVVGLEPHMVCRLVASKVADLVLCEADGAAGRPLKVHGEHEPVVPRCSTSVAVVGGMDAVDQVPGPEVIHRFERYLETVGVDSHRAVSPSACADILVLATETLERNAPVAFILNKADEPDILRAARRVAAEIRARVADPTIVIASHKRFIEHSAALSPAGGGERRAHDAT
jgi:probable selenium-dependent hydroxylase accessory protein YqeC